MLLGVVCLRPFAGLFTFSPTDLYPVNPDLELHCTFLLIFEGDSYE